MLQASWAIYNDFIKWINVVESIFDIHDVPEQLKIKLKAIKIQDYVSLMWDHLKIEHYKKGKFTIMTLGKMQKVSKRGCVTCATNR